MNRRTSRLGLAGLALTTILAATTVLPSRAQAAEICYDSVQTVPVTCVNTQTLEETVPSYDEPNGNAGRNLECPQVEGRPQVLEVNLWDRNAPPTHGDGYNGTIPQDPNGNTNTGMELRFGDGFVGDYNTEGQTSLPYCTPGDDIFADGFESGDTSAWSQTVNPPADDYCATSSTELRPTCVGGTIDSNLSGPIADWGYFVRCNSEGGFIEAQAANDFANPDSIYHVSRQNFSGPVPTVYFDFEQTVFVDGAYGGMSGTIPNGPDCE